jgi:hypothetical protein
MPVPKDKRLKKEPRNKRMEAGFTLLLIISSFLIIWGIIIYRRTIIEPKYLFGVICMGTIVAVIILLFITKDYLKAFWTFFMAAIMGGGTLYFITLYLNRELADEEITSELFDIQSSGTLAKGRSSSCRSPYAVINFYGVEKELVFNCAFENSIHEFKKVKIDYSKGFWGFPVVRHQTLIP